MLSRLLLPVSLVLALWMCAGHWLFNLGGWLTWWYLPTIGLVYVACHYWVMNRLGVIKAKGRTPGRGIIISLITSWVLAILFGFTVPNMHDGSLITLFDHFAGEEYRDLSIGLCNTIGVISITFLGAAVGFSIARARDPKPEMEDPEGPIQMVFPYQ